MLLCLAGAILRRSALFDGIDAEVDGQLFVVDAGAELEPRAGVPTCEKLSNVPLPCASSRDGGRTLRHAFDALVCHRTEFLMDYTWLEDDLNVVGGMVHVIEHATVLQIAPDGRVLSPDVIKTNRAGGIKAGDFVTEVGGRDADGGVRKPQTLQEFLGEPQIGPVLKDLAAGTELRVRGYSSGLRHNHMFKYMGKAARWAFDEAVHQQAELALLDGVVRALEALDLDDRLACAAELDTQLPALPATGGELRGAEPGLLALAAPRGGAGGAERLVADVLALALAEDVKCWRRGARDGAQRVAAATQLVEGDVRGADKSYEGDRLEAHEARLGKHAAQAARDEERALLASARLVWRGTVLLGLCLLAVLLLLALHYCPEFLQFLREERIEETKANQALRAWRNEGALVGPADVDLPRTQVAPIAAATWNVAGVSQNVFEFWGQAPAEVIEGVEDFFAAPGDATVGLVLTPERLEGLAKEGKKRGWPAIPAADLAQLQQRGIADYLKDPAVGKKRFISLPDRLTAALGCGRPGVTTKYVGDLSSLPAWWAAWSAFMLSGPCDLIAPHAAKYAGLLTAEEQRLSQPLQLLHLMLFDGCMLYVLNRAAPEWMRVKRALLSVDKEQLVTEIANGTYGRHDVLLVQEATKSLAAALRRDQKRHVYGGARGQDSLVVLLQPGEDETAAFVARAEQEAPQLGLEPGDACVVRCTLRGETVLVGSYHSDSEGKMTVPFVRQFLRYAQTTPVLLGLDGNVGAGGCPSDHFRQCLKELQLHSCLPEDVWTTFKARTFVQPQLQKAVRSDKLLEEADMGCKDHLLCRQSAYFARSSRDTTGTDRFVDAPLPSAGFPSDHAVVAAEVLLNGVK